MKRIITFCCGILWFYTANSQTVEADVVTPTVNDKFTYDGKDMPHYGLKWTLDSWNLGGYSAWLSGFAGIKLFTYGQPRFVITDVGNIGIGTTSPSRALEINSANGAWNSSAGLLIKGQNPGIEISDNQSSIPNRWLIANGVGAAGDGTLGLAYNVNTNSHSLVVIQNGNIGMGTIAPTQKLAVNGNIVMGNLVDGNQGALYFGNPNHGIRRAGNFIDMYTSGGSESGFSFTQRSQDANGDFTVNKQLLHISNNGNIGVGIDNPQYLLDARSDNNDAGLRVSTSDNAVVGAFTWRQDAIAISAGGYQSPDMSFNTSGSERMRISKYGNIGIGTTNPSQKLSVNGTVLAKKVKVSQSAGDWPDYVFDSSYQLPSLDSVSTFILANKHLPDMPAAATVEKDGHDLGDVQKLLLKKVEELTLYVIELKSNEQKQGKIIESLLAEIEKLKNKK